MSAPCWAVIWPAKGGGKPKVQAFWSAPRVYGRAEQWWKLTKGFTPVGADFPVFLHPKTHEEYALARTERKTARGYHGFVFHTDPGVTLEEDLKRRDLTINAMAMDDSGRIVVGVDGSIHAAD